MLLTRMRNPQLKNDTINVNSRSYPTDGEGCCSVHPADMPTLRDACGFEDLGQVEAKDKEVTIRLPESKEEFLDMAYAIKLTPGDLRDMALLLEGPAPAVEPEPKQVFEEPRTTYVAPPPANQEEMITIPPDEEAEEIEVAPTPETEPEVEAQDAETEDEDEGEEVMVSYTMSKQRLLEIATDMGLPVNQAMKKRDVYNLIIAPRQGVDHGHERQDVQQPPPVG